MQRPQTRAITNRTHLVLSTLIVLSLTACRGRGLVLAEEAQARDVVADLHVQFAKASDSSNQAVMAETDAASIAAANEARQRRQLVDADVTKLKPLLEKLAHTEELQSLETFSTRYQEYKTLDDTILGLAVENTNIKARQLSFGKEQDAADKFKQALHEVVAKTPRATADRAGSVADRAYAAVLEIQVIQARHIPEAQDEAMTEMESQISSKEAAAHQALDELKRLVPAASNSALANAAAALDDFSATNRDILSLSRQNTNVRSLALAFGTKRSVTDGCEEMLQQLAYNLGRHEYKATR